jgi:hypothetical protein
MRQQELSYDSEESQEPVLQSKAKRPK